MTIMTHRSWASVTLVEYDALAILARPDALDLMNAWWDETHAANPFRGEAPTRLSPEGEEWFAALVEKCQTTTDEQDLIDAARAFVRRLGTLMTRGLARAARVTPIPSHEHVHAAKGWQA